ncbi:MAG: ferric iron uptake transcriptional regulator [Gammaproteobacteria bacterium]|nr:ferric iron uptake transcriptional regulator [Gammaproteobacteria bacterium]MBT8151272.1 ferric iron uptake transcriptional regulator [Gammaproteobacteria bacterium]NNL11347.1 ferric iron uptake transcriptional regulator [Pseudomonadales bacterium]NNM11030.1 ferric iron uptake transcriptional regulator [Pseudomonadales bacterium]RZV53544.1 MAG: ferric iron uptake transcriptional regulator [Pseudomonadales bacterium]
MKAENKELKRAGLKVTVPRIKVLQLLENASEDARHMSAEEVYRKLLDAGEDVGLGTVYRVLTQFEAAGLVVRHNFEGGHAVFEIARGEHHDHMVCTETGDIIEFYDAELEALQHRIAKRHGYEIIDHSMVLYVKPKSGGKR